MTLYKKPLQPIVSVHPSNSALRLTAHYIFYGLGQGVYAAAFTNHDS